MAGENKESYFVALKLFLERDDELFIFKDRFGDWDIPGGRITRDEFNVPLLDILRRRVWEELGSELSFAPVERPVVLMRHERVEAVKGAPRVRIFGLGYRANYLGGKIRLSAQHVQLKWVPLNRFEPDNYFTGGWLAGLQDYLHIRRHESTS